MQNMEKTRNQKYFFKNFNFKSMTIDLSYINKTIILY